MSKKKKNFFDKVSEDENTPATGLEKEFETEEKDQLEQNGNEMQHFFHEPVIEQKTPSKKVGIVKLILPKKGKIIVYVNNYGEEVKYNELLHKNLKIGDTLEL